jgi:hypothetical protein
VRQQQAFPAVLGMIVQAPRDEQAVQQKQKLLMITFEFEGRHGTVV